MGEAKGHRGAQDLISGEEAKRYAGQGMPCGQPAPAGLQIQLCHVPEVRPWARHLTSLCLSFLLYTNEKVTYPPWKAAVGIKFSPSVNSPCGLAADVISEARGSQSVNLRWLGALHKQTCLCFSQCGFILMCS